MRRDTPGLTAQGIVSEVATKTWQNANGNTPSSAVSCCHGEYYGISGVYGRARIAVGQNKLESAKCTAEHDATALM